MSGQELVVIDTETYKDGKPILDATGKYVKLGVIMQSNGVSYTFKDPKEMWHKLLELKEKCKKRGRKLVVYGHSMSYDFYNIADLKDSNIKYYSINPFIASYYEREEVEYNEVDFNSWKKYADANKVYYKVLDRALGRVLIEKETEVIKFLDSLAIFRMSAEKLGKVIGLEKLKMPEQTRLGSKKFNELEVYCKRDCEIIVKAMLMLKEKLKEDGVGIRNICTTSQVAIGYVLNMLRQDERAENVLYRNKKGELTEWVHKTKFPEDVHNAYRGGYVRAWQVGEFNGCVGIDCNSLYPYSAMKMRFPDLRTERMVKNPLDTYLPEDLLNKIGISKVMIRNTKDDLGLLVIRTKTKGYIPLSGKVMIGTWTHRELKEAVENGYEIINIEWSIIWDEGDNVLGDIMKKLYEKRVNAENKFNYMFYKDVMNRSIGKFGQYRLNPEIFIDNIENTWKYLGENYKKLRGVSEDSFDMIMSREPEKGVRKKYYAPIIPALVTAEARSKMYNEYKKIPIDRLLYSDTDSILFIGDKDDLKRFRINSFMGDFKVEKDEVDGSELIDKKALIWGTKSKAIGNNIAVSGAFKKGITLEDFRKGEVLIKRMVSIKSGDLNRVGMFTQEVKDLHKQMEEFLEEKNVMDAQDIYIDDKISDLKFFRKDIKRIKN